MKKAVFFDIDGTIIDSMNGIKQIRPAVEKAIKQLQQTGDTAWIATGRPYAFLNEVILDFGFDGLILANGAHIVYEGNTIFKDAMDKKFVKEVIELLEKYHIQYILEGEYYSYMKAEFKQCGDLYEQFGVRRKMLKADYQLENIEVFKIEMLCPDTLTLQICIEFAQQHPEYDHYHSMSHLLMELYSKKNTKATGIMKVLDLLDIPLECSYAFGDGKNDIEMLEHVGCGIAMENAEDYVKKHAKQITGSVQEDGVATGIYKYVLGE